MVNINHSATLLHAPKIIFGNRKIVSLHKICIVSKIRATNRSLSIYHYYSELSVQGPVSVSDKTAYREISQSFVGARSGVKI